jgi:hypothetical protein
LPVGKEATVRRRNWSQALQALALVKIGQDLGTSSRLAHAIHDVIELLIAFTW